MSAEVNPFDLAGREQRERFERLAREFAESGREPVVPRDAATVVLLRPDRSVFLIRRSRGLAFGGMWAFPGGSLEPGETVQQAAVREVAEEAGVILDPAGLTFWHRWLTPVFEPRRYDTWFFLAALPDGQVAAQPAYEADEVRWLTPEQALEQFAQGVLPMLPPTLVTLRDLAVFETVEQMLTQNRDHLSEPYLPSL